MGLHKEISMTMVRYDIGDEIKVVKGFDYDNSIFRKGDIGTIVHLEYDEEQDYSQYFIQWTHTQKNFHDCAGYCPMGFGWCVSSEVLDSNTQPLEELISKNPLPDNPRLRGIALKIIQLEKKFKRKQDAKRSLANV